MAATVIDMRTASGAATSSGIERASKGTAINPSPKPKAERMRVAMKTTIRTCRVVASIAVSRRYGISHR